MIRIISRKIFPLFCAVSFTASVSSHSVPVSSHKEKKDSIFRMPDYDRLFIEKLKSYKGNVRINGDYIITERDTVSFPQTLKAGKTYHFNARTGDRVYELRIERTNFTTLLFSFKSLINNKTVMVEKGEAVLDPFFFNGTNAFDDLETGEIFPAYEYIKKNHDRFLSIHCGTDPDEKGRLRAVVSFNRNPYPVKDRTSPVLKTPALPL